MTPSQAPTAARIDYLESIRGLAAMQVLLLHCFGAFAPNLVFALPASETIGSYFHVSPLYFLYDGYAAVYVFFTLSGFVLSRSFARQLDRPFAAMIARAFRLGIPAMAATMISAAVLIAFGRPNAAVGGLVESDWFATQWNPDVSVVSLARDGIVNALFLGYRGLSGIPYLAPWQQPIEKSFLTPLWTLSSEFYGSLLVLALCLCARRSRVVWRMIVLVGALYFIRSAYICFFVGHIAAMLVPDETELPSRYVGPTTFILFGIVICVMADIWQPEWLRSLCQSPTLILFPGQFPALQQKACGAMLVLAGVIALPAARTFLSKPKLVAWSQLSFPLYLVHWPILFGPTAAFFLAVEPIVGIRFAAIVSIVIGIALSFAASRLFLPIDRFALELSRRLRRKSPEDGRQNIAAVLTGTTTRGVAAE